MTPSIASKWTEEEDGMCKFCGTEVGSAQHILSGCRVALQQGRYRWRHDKVLNQIQSQVAYHLEKRVNNPRRPVRKQRREIPFVKGIVFISNRCIANLHFEALTRQITTYVTVPALPAVSKQFTQRVRAPLSISKLCNRGDCRGNPGPDAII